MFTEEDTEDCDNVFRNVEATITDEDNMMIQDIPSEEEIKDAVFFINPDSTTGPDGYNGLFFQNAWEIIKTDMCNYVHSFFNGDGLSRFFTYSCLVLIPKIKAPTELSHLRPISLANVTNKIISKILAVRFAVLLPKFISENQAGFVKGRLITENVSLAQELIHGIKHHDGSGNLIIKLDMSKAYDRLSWSFLKKSMNKFGFSDRVTDIIFRLIYNNWYSVIINGTRFGFFSSSRGVKQGDPLSPTLFIIAAEVLSRNLSMLINSPTYKGFSMSKKGPQINHLSYADDLILFTSGDKPSVKMVMKELNSYQLASRQLINRDKTNCYTYGCSDRRSRRRLRRWTVRF